jgi:hypothetical protein
MTILFFLKPYQFFDRGGVLKKHIEEGKKRKLEPVVEVLQVKSKTEVIQGYSAEDEAKFENLKLEVLKQREDAKFQSQQLAAELLAKQAKEAELAQKSQREYEMRRSAILAKREKLRIERQDREVFELIHVITQHLEDNPY